MAWENNVRLTNNLNLRGFNMTTGKGKWMATLLAFAAGAVWAVAAVPAEPTLKVGDRAPKLQTGKWVQGQPVTEFKKGQAYIVEFWATWCGPCRVSIPHLNEIYTRYKDKGLIVIGQDCWERDESLVEPFVKKMGEKMTYRVALDDKQDNEKGKMAETWMAAAGQNGIPSAFLVDTKGIIAWIGHPMQLKDKVIEEVLEAKFDVAKAAADYDQQQRTDAKLRTVWADLNRAMQKKDWETANAKVDEAENILPQDQRDRTQMMRFNILIGQQNYAAAYKVAAALSQAQKDNAMLQNDLAWRILTDKKIEQRDLDLAETIAKRADEAAKGADPNIIDTLARAKFMKGNKEEAIALQEKALKLTDASAKDNFRKTLESYKNGELPQGN